MGFYKYLAQNWQNLPVVDERRRYVQWRKQERFTKLDKPTRLDRARALGYKAKPGFVIVRSRIGKGGRKRSRAVAGRKPTKLGIYFNPDKNLQRISEERVQRKYPNLEVLSSYWVGDDGHHEFYEIILVDPQHPQIRSDKDLNWVCRPQNRRRVYRGLTTSGKKGRGLMA